MFIYAYQVSVNCNTLLSIFDYILVYHHYTCTAVSRDEEYPPLVLAFLQNHLDIVEYLKSCGCSLGDVEDKETVLCAGCCQLKGGVQLIKELVEDYNCDPKCMKINVVSYSLSKKRPLGSAHSLFPVARVGCIIRVM